MDKGTTVEMIVDACSALRAERIRVGLFIQFGYPGETRSDIAATIQLIRKLMPDELGISVSYPLPGTRFYERVRSELGETRHWQDSDDLAMLFKGPFNTRY
jgi:anaerobic magnesium-protoporphyrin IX monomethyl ester cyclase